MSYKYETQFNSPNYTPASQAKAVFGHTRTIEGFTLHWWGDPNQNPSYEGVRSYLCRPNGNSSAHIVATGTGRRVSCIVNYSDVAWHSGNAWGNAKTIGIELDPRNRPEDRDVFAEVLADLRSAFGDKPLYWHSYFQATQCPGAYRNLVEELDRLSYTKYSHPTEWGKGGTKPEFLPKPPKVEPKPPEPIPEPPAVPNPKPPKEPSPTTKDPETGETLPDSGKPTTSKDDWHDVAWWERVLNAIFLAINNLLRR